MYRLVIAEKPSVAQSLAGVIGATTKKRGYFEGSGWRVGWCIGHLVGLSDADHYDPKFAKWRYDDLPILPQLWAMEVRKGREKQVALLKKLMCADDVAEVINACDAGREGELIFRTVYEQVGCRKPVKRLWISSMEDIAIQAGFRNLRPGSDYDGLYHAALCRVRADWLVGINATRLFTVLYRRKKPLNVGRVMSPTLALLVRREAEIDRFVPENFYTVELAFPGFVAVSGHIQNREEADALCSALQGKSGIIRSVEKQTRTEKAPALYNLTTLQREANRKLGYTAQQTLDYAQSLYEKKLCTYPRTDSQYLTSHMAQSLPGLVESTIKALPFAQDREVGNEFQAVIRDAAVSDHHAILPTTAIESMDFAGLPEGERMILELVGWRLLYAVSNPHVYEKMVVTLACGETTFTAKGKQEVQLGWRGLEPTDGEKESTLPELIQGQELSISDVTVKEGTTRPPNHFTEDSLLLAMEQVGKEEMPQEAERKGLGTPATRAGILEKLVSAGFLERKGGKKVPQLLPTKDAVSLISVLPDQLASPVLTAQWETRLSRIERGQEDPSSFEADIADMVRDLVMTYRVIQGTEYLFTPPGKTVGRCPRCGNPVEEQSRGFFCRNSTCRFAIWKNNKWWQGKRKVPTEDIVHSLLTDGQVRIQGCYSARTGKTYDATVRMEDDGKLTKFSLIFDPRGTNQ